MLGLTMSEKKSLQELSADICSTGAFLYQRGWCPATSSNFSARLDDKHVLVTASGRHKGELQTNDILCVDLQGQSLEPGQKPSAETLLHTHLYQRDPTIGAVLHTHSVKSTVLSRHYAQQGFLRLADYEVLKALEGIQTHECDTVLPIFPNTQDIASLARDVDAYLDEHPDTYAYCIAGHGFYTWGRDLAAARRHIEALEFLFECEVLHLTLAR